MSQETATLIEKPQEVPESIKKDAKEGLKKAKEETTKTNFSDRFLEFVTQKQKTN